MRDDPYARLAADAFRVETPCGEGRMVWHCWGEGEPLVLLHGGHGSWAHWLRNIRHFSRIRRVIAPDMPGYGQSADLPAPHSVERLSEIVDRGLGAVIGEAPFDMAGFSFGGAVGGLVAPRRAGQLRHFVLVGAGGLGLPRAPRPVMANWKRAADADARQEAHRHNLRALMLHDPRGADDEAVRLQAAQAERTRVRSIDIIQTARIDLTLAGLPIRLSGIWGREDVTAKGFLDERQALLRRLDPQAEFVLIDRAGHWVQYEAAPLFYSALERMLARTSASAGR